MRTAQNVMDNVADQIANASTSGYKKKQVDFTSLLMYKIGDTQVELSVNAKDIGINIGSKAVLSKVDFRQGGIAPSEGNYHMALEGKYTQPNELALFSSLDNPDRTYGAIRHKAMENSNVDTFQSMTDMITTQRAYQANARSITTADTMLDVINQIV